MEPDFHARDLHDILCGRTNCKLVLPWLDKTDGEYTLLADYAYYDPVFKKWITAKKGFVSDGASGKFGWIDYACDYASASWLVHDVLCAFGKWDDGTPITRMQAADVLKRILIREDRPIAARIWWFATGPAATAVLGNVLPREVAKS